MGKFLTRGEVAEMLRVPAETLAYWQHVGRGPRSFKLGRHRLYDEADVIAWVDEQRQAEAGAR